MRAVYVFCVTVAGLLLAPSLAGPVALALFPRTTSTPSCKKLDPTAGKQPQPRSLSDSSSPYNTNTLNGRDVVGVHWFVPGTRLSIVLHTLAVSTRAMGPIGVAIARTLVDAVSEVDEHFDRYGDSTMQPAIQAGESTIDHNIAGLVYLLLNAERHLDLRVDVLKGQSITYWILSAAFRALYNVMCKEGFGASSFSVFVDGREIARGILS